MHSVFILASLLPFLTSAKPAFVGPDVAYPPPISHLDSSSSTSVSSSIPGPSDAPLRAFSLSVSSPAFDKNGLHGPVNINANGGSFWINKAPKTNYPADAPPIEGYHGSVSFTQFSYADGAISLVKFPPFIPPASESKLPRFQ